MLNGNLNLMKRVPFKISNDYCEYFYKGVNKFIPVRSS